VAISTICDGKERPLQTKILGNAMIGKCICMKGISVMVVGHGVWELAASAQTSLIQNTTARDLFKNVKVKVKQFQYRPGQAIRVPGR
jgi:hypothetical protein